MIHTKRYSNTRLREIVADYIHDERAREILIRKYCDNRSIKQLADEFDVSETTVKNTIYRNSFLIFELMEKLYPEDD